MYTSKIYFQRIFKLGPFDNEHYGSEQTLEVGDRVCDAWKKAKQEIDEEIDRAHPPTITQYRPLRQNTDELPVIQEKER